MNFSFFNIDFPALHSALEQNESGHIKETVSQISSTPFCGTSSISPVCILLYLICQYLNDCLWSIENSTLCAPLQIRSVSTLKWNDQLVLFAAGEGLASLATGWGSSSNAQEIKWMENPSTSTLLKLESTNDNEYVTHCQHFSKICSLSLS